MTGAACVSAWQQSLERLRQEWAPLRLPSEPWDVDRAQARLLTLRQKRRDLIGRGLWLGGPNTALQVLGLHTDEATATRVLAWLARPDGQHRMHETCVRLLFELTGVDPGPDLDEVRVVLEDSRTTVDPDAYDPRLTRADLVVYSRQATLLIEAKLYALEQHNQLDRLRACWWGDPRVAFLFLTRHPTQQSSSHGLGTWPSSTWAELGSRLRAAAARQPAASSTALALIEALECIE